MKKVPPAVLWAFSVFSVLSVVPPVFSQTLGFGDEQEQYEMEQRALEARRETVIPFATAVSMAFSTATWSALKVSTAPTVDLTRLLHRGYYRGEVIELVLLAQRAGVGLEEVTQRRDEGASLRSLAESYKLDRDALLAEAERKRAAVEALLPTVSTTPVRSTAAAHKDLPGLKDAPADLNTPLSTATLTLPGGQVLTVEVAATPQQQERGLMYRTELAADRGMLFPFETERAVQFWMKDTWIDLDILYIGADKRITKVFHRVPHSTPETPEDKVVRVRALGKYILELPAGSAKRYKLKKGDRLRFELR